jgi:hypothetical protein
MRDLTPCQLADRQAALAEIDALKRVADAAQAHLAALDAFRRIPVTEWAGAEAQRVVSDLERAEERLREAVAALEQEGPSSKN